MDVRIARGADLTVIHAPPSQGAVSVRVACDFGARVTWITLARAKKNLRIRQEGVVGTRASISWRMVSGGAGDLICNLASHVRGENARSQIEWAARASGQSRHTLYATNHFEAARGSGDIVIRSVASGKAHVSSRGGIAIGPKAAGTRTHLIQEALMLDASAKVDAIPALEIKTNDVKASHSASITKISPETLFYLQSRGIEEAAARSMFVEGFLGELLRNLPADAIGKA